VAASSLCELAAFDSPQPAKRNGLSDISADLLNVRFQGEADTTWIHLTHVR
jgi:hypothetical protein